MEDCGEAAALYKLHGVIVNALIATDAENRHDVRMVQLRRGLGLDLKSLALLGVNRRGKWKHLEGNPSAQGDLFGLIDDAHTSAADFAQDSVFAELGGRGNRISELSGGELRVGKLRGRVLNELQPGETLTELLRD